MKNLASYLGILVVGLILYIVGAKFIGGSGGDESVQKKSTDPALDIYKQFTEYRARADYSLARKLATGEALKKVLKEKAWHRSGMTSDLEVLFISAKFKKVRSKPTGNPAKKSYTIIEERLINNNPNAPGLKTRKNIIHNHIVTIVRKENAWLVSEYEDEATGQ